MIEETIQGIIVTAIAIAPVLYIFLRKWVSKHRERRRDTSRQDSAGRDTSQHRAASPSAFDKPREGRLAGETPPSRGFARLFRRARRPKPGRLPPLPPRQDRDPKPIFDRLRSAETPAPEVARRGQTLTNWNTSPAGERGGRDAGRTGQQARFARDRGIVDQATKRAPAADRAESAGTGAQSASPAVAGRAFAEISSDAARGGQRTSADSREASARTWRRIDRLPGLKRAIILREILGPPRSLARSDEPPAPW